jgi:hypothetical protein
MGRKLFIRDGTRSALLEAGPRGGYTLGAPPAPLDRNDGSPPCSASPAPDPLFEIEHLGLRAEPKPQQKLRREQRGVMAGDATTELVRRL